jgi:hypothetical protein
MYTAADVHMHVRLERNFVCCSPMSNCLHEWRLHGPWSVHLCSGMGWRYLCHPSLQSRVLSRDLHCSEHLLMQFWLVRSGVRVCDLLIDMCAWAVHSSKHVHVQLRLEWIDMHDSLVQSPVCQRSVHSP